MKNVLLIISIFVYSYAIAQDGNDVAVKRAVDFFYDGINERNDYKMKLSFANDVLYQNVVEIDGKKEVVKTDLNELINEISKIEDKAKLKLEVVTMKINVNDFVANAWVTYKIYQFGALYQCGVNSLQLTKKDGSWKIISMLDDHTRKACLNIE